MKTEYELQFYTGDGSWSAYGDRSENLEHIRDACRKAKIRHAYLRFRIVRHTEEVIEEFE